MSVPSSCLVSSHTHAHTLDLSPTFLEWPKEGKLLAGAGLQRRSRREKCFWDEGRRCYKTVSPVSAGVSIRKKVGVSARKT